MTHWIKKVLQGAKNSYDSLVKKKNERTYSKYQTKVPTITTTATRAIFAGKGIFSEVTKKI